MWLLILEAALALGLLLFMVWWVMFSGRSKGEAQDTADPRNTDADKPQHNPPDPRDRR